MPRALQALPEAALHTGRGENEQPRTATPAASLRLQSARDPATIPKLTHSAGGEEKGRRMLFTFKGLRP